MMTTDLYDDNRSYKENGIRNMIMVFWSKWEKSDVESGNQAKGDFMLICKY